MYSGKCPCAAQASQPIGRRLDRGRMALAACSACYPSTCWSCCFFMACTQERDDAGYQPADIIFRTDSGYTLQNDTALVQDTLLIGAMMAEGSQSLQTVYVQMRVKGGAWVQKDSVPFTQNPMALDVQAIMGDVPRSEDWSILAVERGGDAIRHSSPSPSRNSRKGPRPVLSRAEHTMYRTHTCGELRLADAGNTVTLAGWVQRARDLGGLTFIDLRDRYGITQLSFNMERDKALCEQARQLGREFVVQATGTVKERESKNANIPTGEVELIVTGLKVLNGAQVPPFTIEEETDGGDELRMKYRYLDLRRTNVRRNFELRHRMAIEVRNYLSAQQFLEVETPVLIKSTPEGARDFVVPSRMHQGQFYALPQSPQTFKQLLMVAGMDRYFQIVKCFRDEDLRADRQPEFTQIDCEMAFVEQEDILQTFEGLAKHLFKAILGKEFAEPFPRMTFEEAMRRYGCDKPDLRFGMRFESLTAPEDASQEDLVKGHGFKVFDEAELVVGINAAGCANWSRKQTDALIDFVKKPQIGATGIVFVKWTEEGLKSTVDKFYAPEVVQQWAARIGMKQGDLLCIMAGKADKTRKQLNELRLHLGDLLGLRDPWSFKPLWVVDFPLLEQDEESGRWHAMHHPFTSPKPEDAHKLESDPGGVKANAYDLVINGTEIGGGSIRIHDRALQEAMFRVLGFSDADARAKFGFLMDAFEYGAPPHGGAAFGFDRWVSLFGGRSDIREFIAFPKNNAGRDVMIDAPSPIDREQLKELGLEVPDTYREG